MFVVIGGCGGCPFCDSIVFCFSRDVVETARVFRVAVRKVLAAAGCGIVGRLIAIGNGGAGCRSDNVGGNVGSFVDRETGFRDFADDCLGGSVITIDRDH
jgi:hypothetical protein